MKHQLDFEKPIIELQTKLDDLRQHPEKHSLGISFEEEILIIEKKLEETRRQIFLNLTAWQRVQLARHPKRPYTLDYIKHAFTDFHELHGDRLFAEDRAMVGGFARLGGHHVVVIGTEGCAAILGKDRANAAKAAAALKITAKDLLKFKLVDEVIPEPLGGAHTDATGTAANLKSHLVKHLEEVLALPIAERLKARYDKFRAHGHFVEQIESAQHGVVPQAAA